MSSFVSPSATGSAMSGADIKTAYENQANTNAFTDAEKAKLDRIAAHVSVAAFPELASVTAAQVSVGGLAYVIGTGAVYKRVSAGGDLDYTGGGGVRWEAQPDDGGHVRASALGEVGAGGDDQAIAARFFAKMAAGVPMLLDAPLRVTTAIDITCTADFWLTATKAGQLVAAGATANRWRMLNLNVAGHNGWLKLGGVWDGGDKFMRGIEVRNETATKPLLMIDGARMRNFRQQSGPIDTIAGILVVGSFQHVDLSDIDVRNITRAAGLKSGATYSACQAVAITYKGAFNPSRVTVRGMYAENVTSDAMASEPDADGLVIFQELEDGAQAPVVRNLRTHNCDGRSLKLYSPLTADVESVSVFRSRPGKINSAIEVAFQGGTGTLRGMRCHYKGGAHDNGTVPVTWYTSGADILGREGIRQLDGLTIIDETTGGAMIEHVLDLSAANSLQADHGSYGDWVVDIRNVVVRGKAVRHLANMRNLGGTSGSGRVELVNIDAEITQALGECDSAMQNLKVRASGIRNRGATVPVMWKAGAADAAANIAALNGLFGHWIDGGKNEGVARYFGHFSNTPGLAPRNAEFVPGNSGARLSGCLIHEGDIAAGETVELQFNEPACRGAILVESYSGTVAGQYLVNAAGSGKTFAVMAQTDAVSLVVTSSGAEPGGGSYLRGWATGGTVYIKNASGSTVPGLRVSVV